MKEKTLERRLAEARLPWCEDGCGSPSEIITVALDGTFQYRCLPCEVRAA